MTKTNNVAVKHLLDILQPEATANVGFKNTSCVVQEATLTLRHTAAPGVPSTSPRQHLMGGHVAPAQRASCVVPPASWNVWGVHTARLLAPAGLWSPWYTPVPVVHDSPQQQHGLTDWAMAHHPSQWCLCASSSSEK